MAHQSLIAIVVGPSILIGAVGACSFDFDEPGSPADSRAAADIRFADTLSRDTRAKQLDAAPETIGPSDSEPGPPQDAPGDTTIDTSVDVGPDTVAHGSPYKWETGPWDACSNNCGQGNQTREVYCVNNVGAMVTEQHCNDSEKPGVDQLCTDHSDCDWVIGDWGPCSHQCGTGTQTRDVECQRISSSTKISDSLCPGTKPKTSQACTEDAGC